MLLEDGDIEGHTGEGTLLLNSDLRLSEYPPPAKCAAGVYRADEINVIKKSI